MLIPIVRRGNDVIIVQQPIQLAEHTNTAFNRQLSMKEGMQTKRPKRHKTRQGDQM